MTATSSRSMAYPASRSPLRNVWYERVMALIAVANLGLIVFDLSYVPWRNFWLQRTLQVGELRIPLPLPNITPIYDPIKGIEPHRETDRYLKTLVTFENELQQYGIDSTQVRDRLQDLNNQSAEMVSSNPFSAANKSGTLEKIKNHMRERIYGKENKDASSRKAFETFWTTDYLKSKGVQSELTFFKQDIARLIETNYYRSVGEDGQPTDYFMALDLPFVGLFGFELLLRAFFLSRKQRIKFLDALLWRWYDLLLLIPIWRLLRIIPVMIRLDHGKLIHLERLQHQATRGVVGNIAEELTAAVLSQAVTQVQSGLQRGDLAQQLLRMLDKPYQDLNEKDEIQAIVSQVLKLTVYEVLPKIKPDLEAVLRHPIEAVMEQAPGYALFKSVPVLGGVPNQVNQQVVSAATEGAYQALIVALEDKVAAELISQLIRNFGKVLVTELQKGKTVEEIQGLLNELLEEVKVNYVNQSAGETIVYPAAVRQLGGR
jgi:hypothetical protein